MWASCGFSYLNPVIEACKVGIPGQLLSNRNNRRVTSAEHRVQHWGTQCGGKKPFAISNLTAMTLTLQAPCIVRRDGHFWTQISAIKNMYFQINKLFATHLQCVHVYQGQKIESTMAFDILNDRKWAWKLWPEKLPEQQGKDELLHRTDAPCTGVKQLRNYGFTGSNYSWHPLLWPWNALGLHTDAGKRSQLR